MLYSTDFTINNKTYKVKIGVGELIQAEKHGINIMDEVSMSNIENIFRLLYIALKKPDKKSFEDFVEWIDDSDVTIEYVGETIGKAINAGLNKNKKVTIQNEEIMMQDKEEEVKNS